MAHGNKTNQKRPHSKDCKCRKCSSSSSSSSSECNRCDRCSSDPCSCRSSSSSSTPECSDLGCSKICFGHWGSPKCSRCDRYKEYEECDFDKIPSGSIWFAWQLDPFGAIRTLASKECWNRVGIVLQVKVKREIQVEESSSSSGCGCQRKTCRKCYVRVPYVFSVWYDGCVTMEPLIKLARQKTIRKMAVRPIKPTCNKCTDSKRLKQLFCVMKTYLDESNPIYFEKSGASVMRGLFNLDTSNPNFESYSDTKLIYTVLYKAALLNDRGCCADSSPDCSSDVSSGRTTSALTCESRPCDKRCCESSSSCSKCSVDAYQASQATIKDFLYDTDDYGCLDLRWYSKLVPVWTQCSTKGHDEAIDESFKCQKNRLIKDLRAIVQCWSSGRDLPCCAQCRDCNGGPAKSGGNGTSIDCGCHKNAGGYARGRQVKAIKADVSGIEVPASHQAVSVLPPPAAGSVCSQSQCSQCGGPNSGSGSAQPVPPQPQPGPAECSHSSSGSSNSSSCPQPACDKSIPAALNNLDILYTYLSGINYANLPTPIPTTLDGNAIAAMFNQIRRTVQNNCCPDNYIVNSTYTYPSSGGIVVNFVAPPPPPPNPCLNAVDAEALAQRLISQFGPGSATSA